MSSTYSGVSVNSSNISLRPLSPFWRTSGEEEPWTVDDLGVFRNGCLDLSPFPRIYFSMLLELASAVGAPGSLRVVLVLLVQFRQIFSMVLEVMSGN